MNRAKHIIELAEGNMSINGYDYFVSLLKYFINKYNWPKIILDDKTNTDRIWSDEEIFSLTQQFLMFVIDRAKLKNIHKIPESYIEYYFKTILVSYVANKIKEHQNKLGLSFDDTKRISIEILSENYFQKEINNEPVWNKENTFENPIMNDGDIAELAASLPKIIINEKTKHYKPRVKTAINDLFTLLNRPIKQSVLIEQVFKLFDQSSFVLQESKEIKDEIREENIINAVDRIINKINKNEIPLYLDYFFSQTKISLSYLSAKYNLPKSTVHYKTNRFAEILRESFIPNNESEGIFFLRNLHKALDEMQ